MLQLKNLINIDVNYISTCNFRVSRYKLFFIMKKYSFVIFIFLKNNWLMDALYTRTNHNSLYETILSLSRSDMINSIIFNEHLNKISLSSFLSRPRMLKMAQQDVLKNKSLWVLSAMSYKRG